MHVGQKVFRRREPVDPFVDVAPDGRVRIYGTGPRGRRDGGHPYIEYPSFEAMIAGGAYTNRMIVLSPKLATVGAQPWDLMVHRWQNGQEVLYGGVMTPGAPRTKNAKWPDDNWSRRIYPFTQDHVGAWAMHPLPLFNALPKGAQPDIIGHTYGHHFKTFERDGELETWLFHEEVVDRVATNDGPRLKTELFARKMLDPFTASPDKVKLLGVGSPARYGLRANGEFLLEGPRPFDARLESETYHFISFSASDFANDRYDMHFAYRRGDAIGEYTPLTRTEDGVDELVPFGEKLKERYGLSWLGRAHVVQHKGAYYSVFHGVRKAVRPEVDYSGKQSTDVETMHRVLFVVPMRLTRLANGTPHIEMIDDPASAQGPQ